MRLLLDNGLPRSASDGLSGLGHDAVHVGPIGMAAASDDQILARAVAEDRVVVTLDADFHTLLALSQVDRPSVIRIRVEGLRADPLSRLVDQVVTRFSTELAGGAAISVGKRRIACRMLPLR